MGRDIIAAGLLGVVAVIVVTLWHEAIIRVCEWPRRYVRARGYEFREAQHTAAAIRAELDDPQTYATVIYGYIPVAETKTGPPWPLAEPVWQSDLERAGAPLPAWADPEGDRSSAYGLNSGSSGSDYHGGELPAAAEGGQAPRLATGGPGSEPYGVTGPAPCPFGRAPEDAALDETWARLEQAWAQQSSAESPQPARALDSGAVEHGREGEGSTGTATREHGLGSLSPLGNPGDGAAAASPGPGSRLVTRFDVELAAECARFIRDQDADVTRYLERLLEVTW